MFKLNQRIRAIHRLENTRHPDIGGLYRVSEINALGQIKIKYNDSYQPTLYKTTWFNPDWFTALPNKAVYRQGDFVRLIDPYLPYFDITPQIRLGWLKPFGIYKVIKSGDEKIYDRILVIGENKKACWLCLENVKLHQQIKSRIPTFL